MILNSNSENAATISGKGVDAHWKVGELGS